MKHNKHNMVKISRNNGEPTFSAYYDLHADYLDNYFSKQTLDTSILWMTNTPTDQLKIKKLSPIHFTRDTPKQRDNFSLTKPDDNFSSIIKQIEDESLEISNESSESLKDIQPRNVLMQMSRDVKLLKRLSFSSSDEPIQTKSKFTEHHCVICSNKHTIVYDQTNMELNGMYIISFHDDNTINVKACNRRSYDLVVIEGYKGKFLHYNDKDDSIQIKSRFHDYPDYKLYSIFLKGWDNVNRYRTCPIYVKCDILCDITTFIEVFPKLFEYILDDHDDDSTL